MKADEILQAAVKLFAAKGYAATGIRELGREAGLNSATLYHYAGGKEELLDSIMRTCLQQLMKAATQALEGTHEPPVQLARLVRAHVGLSATNPLTSRVTDQEVRALGHERRAELLNLRDDYESLFTRVIERGTRTGDFQITDPRLARLALLEMCNGVANWYRPDGRLTVADVQDRFVEFGCRMVGVDHLTADEIGPTQEPVRLLSEPLTQDLAHEEAV